MFELGLGIERAKKPHKTPKKSLKKSPKQKIIFD